MASITFENVEKRFKDVSAVQSLNLVIRDGEFFTFVGPSGCGKSTILHLIAGLETASAGHIYFDDFPVDSLSPRERDVAMVFQNYALYPHLTVHENLAFPLEMRKEKKAVIGDEVRRIAELLGLESLLSRKPKELSGGQRQRVALGRAIIRKPKIFLMDEPLSNLDARLRIDMRAELKRLHQELKITTIYVTHDQEEALSLSDRIGVIKQGRIEQCGTSGEVYGRPGNIFVAGFIGSPPMNLIPAVIKGSAPLEIDCQGFVLQPLLKREPAGPEVIIGIRPENLIVSTIQSSGSSPVRVSLIESTGSFYWVVVDWKGLAVRGISREPQPFTVGLDAYIKIPPTCLVFDSKTGGILSFDR